MKKLLIYFFLALFSATGLTFVSSCSKPTEDVTVAKALVGIWRFGTANTTVTVDGEDFVDFAVSNFGLTEDEAEAVKEEIIDSTYNTSGGEIIFTNDKNFLLKLYNQDEETGKWSVGAEGETLHLNFDSEMDEFQILDLTAKNLILQYPTDYLDADLDGDGTDETTVEIVVEQTLSEVSNGGAGG